jgi:riboflavin kinase/FMN adenylyltransferase
MRIVRFHGAGPPSARGASVALGNFDGVHRGHRAVLDAARRIAQGADTPFAVLTFEPHPRSVLKPNSPPFRLLSFRSKMRALEEQGVDLVIVVRFSPALAAYEPEAFVEKVLVGGLGVRHVVTGYDFHFGRGRRGTPELLAALAKRHGFGHTRIAAQGDGAEFSSTRVREALKRGEVGQAAQVLGRWWEVEARVRQGARRGRALGYPTANLELKNTLEPARGIYAVFAAVGGEPFRPAVASFGNRPTFGGGGDLLEVHLFDFAGDLYGRYVRVRFVERLREERKFESIEALKAEMARDCESARRILSIASPEGPLRAPTSVREGRRR